jgi:3-oxoacyl-[acyl-carrier protein] reductase
MVPRNNLGLAARIAARMFVAIKRPGLGNEVAGSRGTTMGKLDGKVAIVTGAARGLGRAYAKRLAGLGAKVAVADLNLRSYEEFEAEAEDMTADTTVAEIEAAGGTALGVEVDVRDHEAVEVMVARVVQEWGRVDILVANAGGGRGRPIDTKASTLDPALLQLVTEMNRLRPSIRAMPSPR